MQLERRFVSEEVRAKADAPVIEGYALRFGVLSEDLGGFREFISPEATIEFSDVRALFNHDPNYVIGRQSADTLKLERDANGIRIQVTPPETKWAQDLLVSMRRGDINQQSFAFRLLPDGATWQDTADGWVRTLRAIRMYDVSVVTSPAYPQTDASVRSIQQILADRPAPVASVDWPAIHAARWRSLQVLAAAARQR